mgnify:CR=1 FL=1
MIKKCIIHCKPTVLDYVNQIGYDWDYSEQFGKDEIDVLVDYNDLEDKEFVEYYGFNYDDVNCIEAYNYVA